MGGLSVEREVSLKTGEAVLAVLARRGYASVGIDVGSEVSARLRQEEVALAFIALHGRYGEDGIIQGTLEMMQIPYTGSGVLASALGMDKIASRKIFLHYGIPVPPFVLLKEGERKIFNPSELPFDFPCVVKPTQEGSSVGVTVVNQQKEMERALDEAFSYGHHVLVERFLGGREIHVGVLDEKPLGAIEIRPKTSFYDYSAKYIPGMSEHLFPAPLSPSLYEKVLDLGIRSHQALGCRGYSRVDLIMDEEETPFVLEVNTLPGLTETSLLPEIARGVGIAFDDLVDRILKTALNEP